MRMLDNLTNGVIQYYNDRKNGTIFRLEPIFNACDGQRVIIIFSLYLRYSTCPIFCTSPKFCPTFLLKIKMLLKIKILVNNVIFYYKSNTGQKIKISVQNPNFGQKSKFLLKNQPFFGWSLFLTPVIGNV